MRRFPPRAPVRRAVMRGCAALIALTGLAACANVQSPPGGPPDSTPPLLIAVRPDSFAVVPDFKDRVVFEFDETISERDIQLSVTLYPLDRRPDVDKGKRELRVKPRAGWVGDRIYHVRVHPVVQDLFNNRIREPIDYVFSTGPTIPANRVQGTVYDRLTERPLAEGRVDMVLMPDTLRYGTAVDSAATFAIGSLPVGDYLAIGYEDLNNNSSADAFDRADTVRVSLGPADTLELEFRAFRHDTTGPVLAEVEPIDTLILELGFDGYLDPDAPLDTSRIEIYSLTDSATVPIDMVMHTWAFEAWRDSLAAVRAAELDSLARLEAAESDTAAQVQAPPTPPPSPPSPPGLQAQDTTEAAPPLPLPDRRIYVVAARPIPPGSVRVRAREIVNLSGLVGGGEVTYEQPAPEAPPEGEDEGDPGPPPPGG